MNCQHQIKSLYSINDTSLLQVSIQDSKNIFRGYLVSITLKGLFLKIGEDSTTEIPFKDIFKIEEGKNGN